MSYSVFLFDPTNLLLQHVTVEIQLCLLSGEVSCSHYVNIDFVCVCIYIYSALRKYSAPLNFATFCHISGFKHKDIKVYFFVKNQQQVGHNHELERHLLDISNFFNKSKTEELGVQNYSAPLS